MRLICKAPDHEAEMELDEAQQRWICPRPGCNSAMDDDMVARHEALHPEDEVIVVVPEGGRARRV
jgi:hypothetical protein